MSEHKHNLNFRRNSFRLIRQPDSMEFLYLNYSLLYTRVKIFYCLHSTPKGIYLEIKGADWLDKE